MNAGFDIAAANYDNSFTHTVIGKLQRELVYGHLSGILQGNRVQDILEINCGTGEDAIWLAQQKYTVTATDISPSMVAVAEKKTNLENLSFRQADINRLPQPFPDEKFDLIFSNFGGLNCLSKTELGQFLKNASGLLTRNGQLVLVIMPKNTVWEQLYFLAKADFKSVFRRKKENVVANVDGQNVKTHYFNPKEVAHLASADFRIKLLKPIGFFIPPSYLEPFFRSRPKLVSVLHSLENTAGKHSFLSKYADHYLITLQKK